MESELLFSQEKRMRGSGLPTNFNGLITDQLPPNAKVERLSEDLGVWNVSNFLTEEEVEEFLTYAAERAGRFERGKIFDKETGLPVFTDTRTCTSMELPTGTFGKVLQRMASVYGLTLFNCELGAIIHYTEGQKFNPHVDYLFPSQLEDWKHNGGNRIATGILYLNTLKEGTGGRTMFEKLGVGALPVRGSASFFYNTDETGEGNPLSRHAGEPLIGETTEKWIVNVFIHARPCYVFHTPPAMVKDSVNDQQAFEDALKGGQDTTSSPIPRIIHQLWVDVDGDAPFPYAEYAVNMFESKNLHASWSHAIWTEERINTFIAREYPSFYESVYQNLSKPIQLELARYPILHKYGGVCLGADVVLERGAFLDRLLSDVGPKAQVVAVKQLEERVKDSDVSTFFFLSVPNHPYFSSVMEETTKENPIFSRPACSRAMEKYQKNDDVVILDCAYFHNLETLEEAGEKPNNNISRYARYTRRPTHEHGYSEEGRSCSFGHENDSQEK